MNNEISVANIWLRLIIIGLITGVFAGLFGVGGGVIVIPALVLLAGFDQKLAAGTSLTAIMLTSLSGVISYALSENVDYVAAMLLASGSIIGAWFGAKILAKIPKRIVTIGFLILLLIVIISLFITIPVRDHGLELSWLLAISLVGLGFITGLLAGILGLGGGIIIVPALMLIFGLGDTTAKGTSLLFMVPTAISGTVSNYRNRNVNLPAAAIVGVSAAVSVPLGSWLAQIIDPQPAAWLFAVFLLIIGLQLLWKEFSKKSK